MDWLSDTPMLARAYCPTCEPAVDPLADILEVRYCSVHAPSPAGAEDEAVVVSTWMTGSSECEGATNKRFCDLFHRRPR